MRSPLLSPFLRARRLAVGGVVPRLRGKVLDFGCGAGLLADHVGPDRYFGLDVNAAPIARARARYPQHTFRHIDRDAWLDDLRGHRFDTLALMAIIEHVTGPGALLRDLAAVLAPRWQVIVSPPHPWLC